MYCRYCGKELPNDSNFCSSCGKIQKENVFEHKARMPHFINEHKKVSYAYLGWVLIHIALFLFSSPKGHQDMFGDSDYDLSDGFYPFSESIGAILDGQSYYFSLLYNIDVYDFSEFFFYTILVPAAILGIVKCFPYISPLLKKLKDRYKNWQESNAKKRDEYQANILTSIAQHKEESIIDSIQISPVVEEVAIPEQQESEVVSEKTEMKGESDSDTDMLLQEAQSKDEEPLAETEEEVKKMSLLSRFVGSIIDKIFILIIFVVGFIAISPYGAPGKMGTYIGLRNTPLDLYEYIDKSKMNSYGTYHEGVSREFQDLERLESEPPHIGSTLELDLNITFTFIFLNLLFYILSESLLSASPGKRMLRGVILDSTNNKIGLGKALIRGLCSGSLMVGTYFLLHLQGGLTNTVVVVVFFLLLDVPVFFTKRSLLDLCTGTTYAKR